MNRFTILALLSGLLTIIASQLLAIAIANGSPLAILFGAITGSALWFTLAFPLAGLNPENRDRML